MYWPMTGLFPAIEKIVDGQFFARQFVAGQFVADNSSPDNSSHGQFVAGQFVARICYTGFDFDIDSRDDKIMIVEHASKSDG